MPSVQTEFAGLGADRHRSPGADQDLRTVVVGGGLYRAAEAVTVQRQHGGSEFRCRGVVENLDPVPANGCPRVGQRGEVQHPEQFGDVDVLGRQSTAPFIRFFCIMLIEVVRGVPLITVLFMANTMLPLFVPDAWTPDRLLRPLIGVALFASVYMAEVVRGGLQSVPRGQLEGAMALGLTQSKMMRLIVLPQALTIVIPGIVNSFIALFKDTTLVAIVGVFDFLRAIDTQRLDPAWNGPTISTTGYAFAAMFYFVFCFAMSRYSLMMERRLAHGRKR